MGRHIPIETLTKLISIDEFKKLVSKVVPERNKIAILLLFGTGMRVEESVTNNLKMLIQLLGATSTSMPRGQRLGNTVTSLYWSP